MIIFSIICAVMCFLSAIILFMPKFRKYPFFKPFGVYLAYQGIWTLLSCLIDRLFPTNQVMTVLSYLGSLIFCLYFLFIYLASQRKSGKAAKKTAKAKKSKQTEKKPKASESHKPRYRDEDAESGGDSAVTSSKKKHFAASETEPEERTAKAQKSSSRKSKGSRFFENSKGNTGYSLEDELYDEADDYDTFDDDEDAELENVEITDEDLDYSHDGDDEDSGDDISIDDEDIYFDFDDEDDDEDDDDSFTLKGRRYRK